MTDILQGLAQALADRYAIEREIGAGGMATVYLAEDLKHHRKVAVKVLRPELVAASDRLSDLPSDRLSLLRHALRRGRDTPRSDESREAALS